LWKDIWFWSQKELAAVTAEDQAGSQLTEVHLGKMIINAEWVQS